MNNYVDNEKFLKLLTDYQKHPEPKPQIPNEIGKIFMLIASNILNKPQCINFTKDRKDEIISRMIYYMCLYINNFKTSAKTSPFSYFTAIAWSHFQQYCNLQKKHLSRFINVGFIENMDNELEIGNDNSGMQSYENS